MRPRRGQTQRKAMSLDKAKTSARKDGSDLDLLGPAPPLGWRLARTGENRFYNDLSHVV